MFTAIMRVFPAYDLQKLLNTPYAHILKLVGLAEKASSLQRLDIFTGTIAQHDEKLAMHLQEAERTASAPDPDKVRELYSDEAKRRAQEIAERVTKGT